MWSQEKKSVIKTIHSTDKQRSDCNSWCKCAEVCKQMQTEEESCFRDNSKFQKKIIIAIFCV